MRSLQQVKGRGIESDTLQVGEAEIYPADVSPLPGVGY